MKQETIYKNSGKISSEENTVTDEQIAKYLEILKTYQSLIPSVNNAS